MECNFTVGQKVVCLSGENHPVLWTPKTGAIYTIRSVFVWNEKAYIRLQEHSSDRCDGPWGEGGWDATRFRPVVERKTDISVFKAMLNPSKEQVPA